MFRDKHSADEVIARKDEHYIQGKWVECKTAILRQEMEQKYGQSPTSQEQSLSPKRLRPDGGLQESYDDSSGFYASAYDSHKPHPQHFSGQADYSNSPGGTDYFRYIHQPYDTEYYRGRDSRPRRAEQFPRAQVQSQAIGKPTAASGPSYMHQHQGYGDYYGSSHHSPHHYDVSKPTYVQSHRVHRGMPSNYSPEAGFHLGPGMHMNIPMLLPIPVTHSPPRMATHSPKSKQSPSPVRPIPVPLHEKSNENPSPRQISPLIRGMPVGSPPRSSQSPVRPIPVPLADDADVPEDDLTGSPGQANVQPQLPPKIVQQAEPSSYQMFGRVPSPVREPSTSGQYFSLYGGLPGQKEVSSSRNSPKLAEYKKYYSPTQKNRNEGRSKLYEKVFHLNPEVKSPVSK